MKKFSSMLVVVLAFVIFFISSATMAEEVSERDTFCVTPHTPIVRAYVGTDIRMCQLVNGMCEYAIPQDVMYVTFFQKTPGSIGGLDRDVTEYTELGQFGITMDSLGFQGIYTFTLGSSQNDTKVCMEVTWKSSRGSVGTMFVGGMIGSEILNRFSKNQKADLKRLASKLDLMESTILSMPFQLRTPLGSSLNISSYSRERFIVPVDSRGVLDVAGARLTTDVKEGKSTDRVIRQGEFFLLY